MAGDPDRPALAGETACRDSGRAPSAGCAVSVPCTTTALGRPCRGTTIRPIASPSLAWSAKRSGEHFGLAIELRGRRAIAARSAAVGYFDSRSASWSRPAFCCSSPVDRGDRLLVGEGQADVGQHHEAGRDQRPSRRSAPTRDMQSKCRQACRAARRAQTSARPRCRRRRRRKSSWSTAPHRLLSGRSRAGGPGAAALFGRPRHQRDAALDPGDLRGRDRHPDVNLGQPGEDYEVVTGKAQGARRGRGGRRRRARGVRRGVRAAARSAPTRSTGAAIRCSPRWAGR